MSALSIEPTYPTFTDSDGSPLDDGYVWIGAAGSATPIANPQTAYWDAALTQVVTQPVRTRGGYPLNAGAVGRLYVNGDYSILVRNRNGYDLYSAPNATERVSSELVTFLQAGTGAVTRTAQSKMRDVVSVLDFGADPTGNTDSRTEILAAIDAAVGKTLLIPAGTFEVSNTIDFKNGVNVECQGTIKARAGFSGSYIATFGATATYTEGLVNGLRLDGNGQNIKGLYTQSVQNSFFNDTFVRGCLDTGIQTGSGYEHIFNRFWILGAASGMTAAAPGLLAGTGDSHFTDGIVTLYPIGVKAQGGNSVFTRIHPWAVYTVGSTPMLHGFWCTGEGNRFQDCTPDSPDLANRSLAASFANGGYGFYVDSGAINSNFSDCKLIVANNVNAPVGDLYFGYVSGAYCTFDDCRTDDNSGGAMAGNLQYASTTRARETAVYGGFAAGRLWLGDGSYNTFTPDLFFGGVEISTAGGGYFSGRRQAYWWRMGPLVHFNIHIRITSKGSATGAVTVGTLPFAAVNFGNNYAVPVSIQLINPGIAGSARFNNAATVLTLTDTATGNALTDASFGVNQEFWISGVYAVSTAP